MANQPAFAGAIPENYDRYLGPVLFEPYAQDLAGRLPKVGIKDVLELACGTGISTKAIRARLPEEVRLVATDLSEAMIELAKRRTYDKKVEWKAVDAMSTGFKANSFDRVVAQFGLMFLPDKEAGLKEVLRILRPGGQVLMNVWDNFERNPVAKLAKATVLPLFPSDPPGFYDIPWGYNDQAEIRRVFRAAGFVDVAIAEVEKDHVSASARDAAMGYVQGNPIAGEIASRLDKSLDEVTSEVENAFKREFGSRTPMRTHMQALVISAKKPA